MIKWHIERRKVADLIEYEGNPRCKVKKICQYCTSTILNCGNGLRT